MTLRIAPLVVRTASLDVATVVSRAVVVVPATKLWVLARNHCDVRLFCMTSVNEASTAAKSVNGYNLRRRGEEADDDLLLV